MSWETNVSLHWYYQPGANPAAGARLVPARLSISVSNLSLALLSVRRSILQISL